MEYQKMLTVHTVLLLPPEVPIVGVELTPYVLLRLPDKTASGDDVPEVEPVEGQFLRYKWYLKEISRCCLHPSEKVNLLECQECVKDNIHVAKRYFCSNTCFGDAWPRHRAQHHRGNLPSSQSKTRLLGGTPMKPPFYNTAIDLKGETWFEVGKSKTYTPVADDIGHALMFECVVVNTETRLPQQKTSILTSPVIPAPSPTPRRVISVRDSDARISPSITFSVLSYNILSESHATDDLYGYCPSWALSWPYRRQNLLREIVDYHADIICLQEVQKNYQVQKNHFEDFLKPELDKHGYEAVFRQKSTEGFSGNKNTLDGCATFFSKDKFSFVREHEAEFNEAAHSLTKATLPATQRKAALERMIKDNVALVLVLEAKFGFQGSDSLGKRQRELNDVKLWQAHILLKTLKGLADIPILVCGDFNSLPGSALHAFLATGKVDRMHLDMRIDPLAILQHLSKSTHTFPLVSAYSSFARTGAGPGSGLENQRKKMDPTTYEPLFTNCTRDFTGTRDYIFYSDDSLIVEGLLELLDEGSLRKDTALPSPEWSSDHIALLAEFRYKPKIRR